FELPHLQVNALAFSADGALLATGNAKSIQIVQLKPGMQPGAPYRSPIIYEAGIKALCFTGGWNYLVVGGRDNSIGILEVQKNSAFHLIYGTTETTIMAMACSEDGHWLVTGNSDKVARLFEISTEQQGAQQVQQWAHGSIVNSVAISPDGRWIATGSS